MRKALIATLIGFPLIVSFIASVGRTETERHAYQRFATKYQAKADVHLEDGSWADMMSDEYVYEVDWAKDKWKEAIGQSLWYSIASGKKPAIVLLTTGDEREKMHIERCRKVCDKYNIRLFLEPSTHSK